MRLFVFFLFAFAPDVFSQSFEWSAHYQFPAAGGGKDIVSDKDQNAIVAGEYEYSSHDPVFGCFISQYKSNGSMSWTIDLDRAMDIKISYDVANDHILAKLAELDITKGGGYYLKKYDLSGKEVQSILILPMINGTLANKIHAIAADNSGGYVIAGTYQKNFAIGTFTFSDPPPGFDRFFIARFNNKDSCLWVTSSSSGSSSYLVSLSIDKNDEVIVAGRPIGDLVIGAHMVSTDADASTNFIFKLDKLGAVKWALPVNVTHIYTIEITDIGTDLNNNIFVYGKCEDNIVTPCPLQTTSPGGDLFLMQLNPAGECHWLKLIGGSGIETATGLVIDPIDDGVYIAGNFPGTLTAGSVSLTSTKDDGFVMKFDNSGNAKWALVAGEENSGLMNISAITATKEGNVFLTGQLKGNASFGGHQLFNNRYDFFVAGISDKHITGVPAISSPENLSFYPNPSNGIIHCSLNKQAGVVHVSVYNISGQKIKDLTIEKNEMDIDLTSVPKGIYLIHCNSGNTSVVFKQVVN